MRKLIGDLDDLRAAFADQPVVKSDPSSRQVSRICSATTPYLPLKKKRIEVTREEVLRGQPSTVEAIPCRVNCSSPLVLRQLAELGLPHCPEPFGDRHLEILEESPRPPLLQVA